MTPIKDIQAIVGKTVTKQSIDDNFLCLFFGDEYIIIKADQAHYEDEPSFSIADPKSLWQQLEFGLIDKSEYNELNRMSTRLKISENEELEKAELRRLLAKYESEL